MSRHSNTKNPLWLPLLPNEVQVTLGTSASAPNLWLPFLQFQTPHSPRPQEGAVTCFFCSVVPSIWNVFYLSPHPTSSQPSSLLSSKAGFKCLFEILPEVFSPPSGSHVILSYIHLFCSCMISIYLYVMTSVSLPDAKPLEDQICF